MRFMLCNVSFTEYYYQNKAAGTVARTAEIQNVCIIWLEIEEKKSLKIKMVGSIT